MTPRNLQAKIPGSWSWGEAGNEQGKAGIHRDSPPEKLETLEAAHRKEKEFPNFSFPPPGGCLGWELRDLMGNSSWQRVWNERIREGRSRPSALCDPGFPGKFNIHNKLKFLLVNHSHSCWTPRNSESLENQKIPASKPFPLWTPRNSESLGNQKNSCF